MSPFYADRRGVLIAAGAGVAAAVLPGWALAQTGPYPNRPIELVVPSSAGGGTDGMARALSDVMRKHLTQPLVVVNKPGASGAIGMQDVLNARPDGYKVCVVFAELAILPHMGQVKFTADDFTLIARLNADPSAITVKADAPWKTIEEFLAAARSAPGKLQVGNAGIGSIWHLAAAALEDRTQLKFNQIPFQGAAPAIQALLGGHLDAVAVSPGEVSAHVASGKLRTPAVMADQRFPGFDGVPTMKERGIDVSVGTWRGLAVPKGTPPDVVAVLKVAAKAAAEDPAFREALGKLSLGFSYADADAFRSAVQQDHAFFKQLIPKLGLRA